ncbi:hypothetical protein [Chitinimonas sp.]|uniref:hypothetical protein n=1 Tax=Chitinimonas sp. TaxID=1934313 RepID=UPI002F95588E
MNTTAKLLATALLGLTMAQALADPVIDEYRRATRGDFARVLEVKQNLNPDYSDAQRRGVENASVGPYIRVTGPARPKQVVAADYSGAYRRAARLNEDTEAAAQQLVLNTGNSGDSTSWLQQVRD